MLTVRELTPRSPGAVSVLVLEGEGALEAGRALTGRARLAPGEVFATTITVDDEPLDEVLVVVRSELLLELHLHGSPPLVDQVLELLRERHGAGQPSGLRILEERAAARVATAPSTAGARLLLDQAAGALRAALNEIAQLDEQASKLALQALLQRGQSARFLLRPAVVVLAGPVNAGKSTLFNLLVGEQRALTSNLEGTTRDLVRSRGLLGPWAVEWIDTAGARALPGQSREDEIEREGQALSRSALEECDLCFWLTPEGAGAPGPAPKVPAGVPVERLWTFADRAPNSERAGAALSVPADPERAVRLVTERFEAALGLQQPAWQAGQAVPFEPGQLDLVAGWLELEGAERAAELRNWLARS